MRDTTIHIALIEDDLARLTTLLLQNEGYQVSQHHTGENAAAFIQETQPNLLRLNVLLPEKNGMDIYQEIRAFYQGPVLMLTGCDDDMSEILAFQQGADDYITKPIKPPILLARIRAMLKRYAVNKEESTPITLGGLHISPKARTVFFDKHPIVLTTSEFDLLCLLATYQGQIVTREQCCEELRGLSYDGHDRSIDMRISALRKKLADTDLHIVTIRSKGYQLNEF